MKYYEIEAYIPKIDYAHSTKNSSLFVEELTQLLKIILFEPDCKGIILAAIATNPRLKLSYEWLSFFYKASTTNLKTIRNEISTNPNLLLELGNRNLFELIEIIDAVKSGNRSGDYFKLFNSLYIGNLYRSLLDIFGCLKVGLLQLSDNGNWHRYSKDETCLYLTSYTNVVHALKFMPSSDKKNSDQSLLFEIGYEIWVKNSCNEVLCTRDHLITLLRKKRIVDANESWIKQTKRNLGVTVLAHTAIKGCIRPFVATDVKCTYAFDINRPLK